MKQYDTFIIGHISRDEIVINGKTESRPGGAVEASSYAAIAGNYKTGVLTKTSQADRALLSMFSLLDPSDVYFAESSQTTSIRNVYLTPDMERRDCFALSHADAFSIADIPEIESRIFHLAGLIAGDYDSGLFPFLARKGLVAADMQGFLRTIQPDRTMALRDWPEKTTFLPYIHFLKTDAAEAEVMTGTTDRRLAARRLHEWGAREVMITHNTEALVFDGKEYYAWPLVPRNLSGRTGRGDTCFSAYITERLGKPPRDALLYAAAMVSLKMETPGPFKGSRNDVEDYIEKFYRQ
ncbi:MAG: PfkB family carbohydrate kinase [Spirochaetaceae bacterium]|nr:PfkB family carbohydrate kinase [Spirochaetaceae bacterium]